MNPLRGSSASLRPFGRHGESCGGEVDDDRKGYFRSLSTGFMTPRSRACRQPQNGAAKTGHITCQEKADRSIYYRHNAPPFAVDTVRRRRQNRASFV